MANKEVTVLPDAVKATTATPSSVILIPARHGHLRRFLAT